MPCLELKYEFLAGEFEAYLALEKELAETKDTNARIQLMTALKLQQRRMVENWKRPRPRPKVSQDNLRGMDILSGEITVKLILPCF